MRFFMPLGTDFHASGSCTDTHSSTPSSSRSWSGDSLDELVLRGTGRFFQQRRRQNCAACFPPRQQPKPSRRTSGAPTHTAQRAEERLAQHPPTRQAPISYSESTRALNVGTNIMRQKQYWQEGPMRITRLHTNNF